MKNLVKKYDPWTRKITLIPASKLAPGMVQILVDGMGPVWIDAAVLPAIRKSDHRHPPFGDDVRNVLREIKEALGDADHGTLDEMEDGFRRDMHPEKEIAIWLHIAKVFRECTAGKTTSLRQREGYLAILLMCSLCPEAHVPNVIAPKAISAAEARKAIAAFYRRDDGTEATGSPDSMRLPAPISVRVVGAPKAA